VKTLHAPHVFLAERDGRQVVLKARLVGDDKAAMRAFEKVEKKMFDSLLLNKNNRSCLS
jgi:hypothetical protein